MQTIDQTKKTLNNIVKSYDSSIAYRCKDKKGRVSILIDRDTRDTCADLLRRLVAGYMTASSKDYDYPQNLLMAIYQDPLKISQMSEDYLGEALSKLSPREQIVLRKRYREKSTLEETGQTLGVTRERIRQVEAKALRKLRLPAFSHIIEEGEDTLVKYQNMKQTLAEATQELNKEVIKIRHDTSVLQKILETKTVDDEEKEIAIQYVQDNNISIDNLGLSNRAYNCLERAGYRYLSDFIGITDYQLKKIRNLGIKSYMEIVEKLKEWEIEVKEA